MLRQFLNTHTLYGNHILIQSTMENSWTLVFLDVSVIEK